MFMRYLLGLMLVAGATTNVMASDLPGSKDHPLVSRFKGSQIIGYSHDDFGKRSLPVGPASSDGISKSQQVSGVATTVVYRAPVGKQPSEIMENYRRALLGAGFKIDFTCEEGKADGGCGGYAFATQFDKADLANIKGFRNDMIDALDSAEDKVSFINAHLTRSDGTYHVGIMVSQANAATPGILVDVVEETQMAANEVTVDANAMAKGLAAEGKIALYGLTFDTDSAKLTAASDATLKQMSDLLHKQPTLKVYIVGHTDNTGALAHNLTLSQQRAESVVKALSTTYGIAANRLGAKGVASYAPVASNHDDAGKARNRRVELVEQ